MSHDAVFPSCEPTCVRASSVLWRRTSADMKARPSPVVHAACDGCCLLIGQEQTSCAQRSDGLLGSFVPDCCQETGPPVLLSAASFTEITPYVGCPIFWRHGRRLVGETRGEEWARVRHNTALGLPAASTRALDLDRHACSHVSSRLRSAWGAWRFVAKLLLREFGSL